MDVVASTTEMITTLVSDIFSVLFSGLGVVLPYIAGLIGLAFIIKFVGKKIGRPKG